MDALGNTSGISSGGSRIFPGGAPTPKSAIIFQFFAENCMKMKEFGPPGGGARPWRPPLDPPMISYCSSKSSGRQLVSFEAICVTRLDFLTMGWVSIQIEMIRNYFLGNSGGFYN